MGKRPNNIYNLLLGAERRRREKAREELLRTVGVSVEYFEEGSVTIDKFTCRGDECKLCIKVCPTNALYWYGGEVKIEDDLCIYCDACVLSCIVDNCIVVTRKRKDGKVEKFSTPREAILVMNNRSVQQRGETILTLLAEMAMAKVDKK